MPVRFPGGPRPDFFTEAFSLREAYTGEAEALDEAYGDEGEGLEELFSAPVAPARVLRPAAAWAAEAGPRTFRSPRFQGDATLDDVLNGRLLLQQGSRGPAVTKIQQALLDMGYPLPRAGADGNFGPETRAAVIRFQTDRRQVLPAMQVDGIVGPQTMGQLDEAIVTLRVRKDVTTLTPGERTALAAAINSLKTSGVYHAFVRDHSNSMSTAHRQSAFFPWHRAFILNFESELRAIDPTISLPYWNWSADPGVVGGSPLWNSAMAALMGGNGTGANSAVTTGPFAGWMVADSSGTITALPLQRTFGVDQPTLPPLSDVTRALGLVPYDASPWDDANTSSGFRNELEGWAVSNRTGTNALHNAVHVWVGGSMEPGTSPNDPCFFLHHCFVDKLWADWQAAFPSQTYLPATRQPRPSGVNAFGIRDDMAISQVTAPTPFTVKPAETLNNRVLRDQRGTRGIVVRYV